MGTYYTIGASKKDIIAELTQGWENRENGSKCKILAHAIRGNVLWTVCELTKPDDCFKERFIVCNLLSTSDGSWGYKSMDESCGPCYYSCPLKYLEMAPNPIGGYAVKWREQVREYHRRKRSNSSLRALSRIRQYLSD